MFAVAVLHLFITCPHRNRPSSIQSLVKSEHLRVLPVHLPDSERPGSSVFARDVHVCHLNSSFLGHVLVGIVSRARKGCRIRSLCRILNNRRGNKRTIIWFHLILKGILSRKSYFYWYAFKTICLEYDDFTRFGIRWF